MTKISTAIEKETGLYTLQEAAWYARLPQATLRAWFSVNNGKKGVLAEGELIEDGSFISFVDFIQTLAIRAIRVEKKIPLQRIRDAVKKAEDTYGLAYPFARKHTTYLSGKDLFIQLEDMDDLIQVSGKNPDQVTSKKIIEFYLEEVSFDPETGLARLYKPYENIKMDPSIGFGQPLVETCNVPAVVLWESVRNEESFEKVAELYGIEVEDVKTAFSYCDSLTPAA